MTSPLEHDYIGLSEVSSMENSDKISSSSSTLSSEEETKTKTKTHTKTNSNNTTSLNLKETELRLGLPGSMSPQRGVGAGLSLQIKGVEEKNGYQLGVLKNFVSGAKRGFSDAIDANGKWGFSGNGGSEADLGKGGVLFSPRGGNGGKTLGGIDNSAPAVKEVVPPSPKPVKEKKPQISSANDHSPPAKAQVVGWPPVRAFRKNMAANSAKNNDDAEDKSGSGCLYVKVSMDGAPYLRKVDLKIYSNYTELSSALEKMFSCFTIGHCSSHGAPGRDGLSESRLMDLLHGSEYVLTYEDKDSDWMLVGDVPWDMFTDSCKRLRIMKGSEAIGFAQCKIRN